MHVEALEIPEVKLLTTRQFGDSRGFLSETYNRRTFQEAGIQLDLVQENHSHSANRHTLRGLHFQTPPYAQAKLVRVVRGAVLDVAVDLRTGSPTFGHHVSAVLSPERFNQLLVPVGFAHGFLTLEPDTEVLYKVDQHYAPDHDAGVLWRDPDIGIDWDVDPDGLTLSDKDARLPKLADLPPVFSYGSDGR